MPELNPTPRTTVKRKPERGRYDRSLVHAVIDEALICHVGFVVDGQPYVIPTIHARLGDQLYLHGSPASRMLRTLKGGVDLCVTVTLVDGLVMARSVFHHSLNYRSVVVLGRGREIRDRGEKLAALEGIVEHIAEGRWSEARIPNDKELTGTLVVGLALDECSAKVRRGPPIDDVDDIALDVWAGVIPVKQVSLEPEPAPDLRAGIDPSAVVTGYRRPVTGS